MNVKYLNIKNNDTLLSLHCLTSDDPEDLSSALHIHDEIEIVYILQGTLSLWIENKTHALKKNDIVIINRLIPHQFFDNNLTKVILLQFKPAMVYEGNKAIDIKYLKPFIYNREFTYFVSPCDTPAMTEMVNVIKEIEQKIHERDVAYDLAVESLLIQLLYLMHHSEIFNMKIAESSKQNHDLQRFSILLKYMDDHYNELITLEQACVITRLDYHYFSRAFKEKTGQSFVEYLSFIRILKAQTLLCETDEAIATIAEKVGIPNISYFNRKFKSQNGMTPSEYREANRESGNAVISPAIE